MTDAMKHDIMGVDVRDGPPDGDVPLDALRSGLESDDNIVRTHAAKVAAVVSQDDPGEIAAVTPALLDALEDDHRVVLFQTTIALWSVAEVEPGRLEPAIDRLVELLGHDLPVVQTLAARTLGAVALEHPEFFTDHVEALLAATEAEPSEIVESDRLDEVDRNPHGESNLRVVNREGQVRQIIAREITANLLVEVADHDANALVPHAERVVALLDDQDAGVASAAADVVGTLATADRDAVADAVDPLRDLLDDPDDSLVATAVTALGFLGDRAAVEPLRALADDEDRDDDLRDLAAETADFLDD